MITERSVVAKFGGSSMASADSIRRVTEIIQSDPGRRFIVVSAPGVNKDNPIKITDLLILCGKESFMSRSFNNFFRIIESRFLGIADGLGVCIDVELEKVRKDLLIRRENENFSVAWAASRGEWLAGNILARYLEADFIDAEEVMRFQEDGVFDHMESYQSISQKLIGQGRCVIPGFYGQDRRGRIRIFPRGGSDITGAYIAAGLRVQMYENWTDVDGVMTADPRIVPQARSIPFLTYEEMAELGYQGAKVLHPLSVWPCEERGIPINVRNTFNPQHPGTVIGAANFLLEKKCVVRTI